MPCQDADEGAPLIADQLLSASGYCKFNHMTVEHLQHWRQRQCSMRKQL